MYPSVVCTMCSTDSLNLVVLGTHAVKTYIVPVSVFFDYLQDTYSFMVASTYRWEILMKMLKPNQKVVKRATGTRWSSRHNACSAAFVGGWKEFLETLESVEKNKAEPPKCSRKAAGLRTYFEKFESVFLAIFWTAVLEWFEKTNIQLQATITNLKNIVDLYNSLVDFVSQSVR